MKNKDVTNKMVLSLPVAMILAAFIASAIWIDHPVLPFQKAKVMALMEGVWGAHRKMYILMIKGWGAIMYNPRSEVIMLVKRTPEDSTEVDYAGKTSKYYITRRVEGGNPETTSVDWSVAMDIANRYLREIEAARGK
jgi:hypothetical protein